MLPACPVQEDYWYISAGVGSALPFRSCLSNGSHLFVPPVCRGLVLWESRVLHELLLSSVIVCSRAFRAQWWSCIMPSGTGLPDMMQAGVASASEEPIPGMLRGFDLTLQSDSLYDLDTGIPDVIGLSAVQPDAAVVKLMSIPDNRCIRVVIPDDNVGTDGFHEVLIHDMADANTHFVPVIWGVFDWIGRKHYFRIWGAIKLTWYWPVWIVYRVRKFIHGDLGRHVASFHLDSAQCWRCPVAWCTVWRGTPQDCIYHMCRAHTIPASIKVANLE